MARPREFDEQAVLNAAMNLFWELGYQVTSMRDLAVETGLTSPSLYNAFGDKRALYLRVKCIASTLDAIGSSARNHARIANGRGHGEQNR